MKVDLHILTIPGREEWLEKCLESLKDEPVNIRILEGITNNLGLGRFNGFSLGSSELVTCVDDDDWIEPGIVQKCIDALNRNPDCSAAFSRTARTDVNGNVTEVSIERHVEEGFWHPDLVFLIHKIIVYRRSALEPYLKRMAELPSRAEHTVNFEMSRAGHKFVQIPEIGYYWRIHDNCEHKINSAPLPKNR